MAKLNRSDLERLNVIYEEFDAVRRRLAVFMKPATSMEITMQGMRVRIGADEEIRKLIVGHLVKCESILRSDIESMGFEVTNHLPSEEPTDA